MRRLVSRMEGVHDSALHRSVSQFYYMQKIEELQLLLDQLAETEQRLNAIRQTVTVKYTEVFARWSKDARRLNLHSQQTGTPYTKTNY